MKTRQKTLLVTAGLMAAMMMNVQAQTTYVGVGSGTALDIDLTANWSPATLPTSSGNPGTINVNSTVDASTGNFTYTDYYITLTGGVMSQFNSGNDPVFSGGSFTVNGGTYGTSGGRAFRSAAGNVGILTSGTINSGSNGAHTFDGSSFTVNGGLFQQHGTNRSLRLTNGATFTVNPGGTFTMDTSGTATGTFGVNKLSTGSNAINLNGGTTTANFLAFGNSAATPRLKLTLGGTTAGTLTAVDFLALSGDEVIGARRIDWLTGTQMEMSITNAAGWAEAEWAAGRMTYNSDGFGTLGNWATVTSSGGLGGGANFSFDTGTNTLSVIPEPSTFVLVGLAGLAALYLRRRR